MNSFEREKSKLSNNIKQISKSNNKDEFVIPKRFNKAKQLPTTNGNIKMSNRFNELIVNNDDDDFELVKDTVTLKFTFFLKKIFFHKYIVFVIYYKFSKRKI